MRCPKCGKDSIINIDTGLTPVMFECLGCKHRFHAAGFQLTGTDANMSLDAHGSAILSGILK
jgi:ribosomal protein L37AE/L43A